MRFLHITTFFGSDSFGGDSVYVERLAASLLSRGHQVEVAYVPAAFQLLHGRTPHRQYTPPPGLTVHRLGGPHAYGTLLAMHQTGRAGPFGTAISRLLESRHYDVVHFHNISLAGGTALFRLPALAAVPLKLMSVLEHWLVCPLSLLWRYNREHCTRPTCISCCLRAGRPPQPWRSTAQMNRDLSGLDALIFQAGNSLAQHTERGIRAARMPILSLMLPTGWGAPDDNEQAPPAVPPGRRPAFLTASRLVRYKGVHTLLPLFARHPEFDLLIASDGPERQSLERAARNLPNVRFTGLLPHTRLRALFRDVHAVLVPSLWEEPFGLVASEAAACGTPVVARRTGGLPEVLDGQGGVCYQSEPELERLLQDLAGGTVLPERLRREGLAAGLSQWSEAVHYERYRAILSSIRPELCI